MAVDGSGDSGVGVGLGVGQMKSLVSLADAVVGDSLDLTTDGSGLIGEGIAKGAEGRDEADGEDAGEENVLGGGDRTIVVMPELVQEESQGAKHGRSLLKAMEGRILKR